MKDRGTWDHSAVQNQSMENGRYSKNVVGVHLIEDMTVAEGDFFYLCPPVTHYRMDTILNWIWIRSYQYNLIVKVWFNVDADPNYDDMQEGQIWNAADCEYEPLHMYSRRLAFFYTGANTNITAGGADERMVWPIYVDASWSGSKYEPREKLVIPDSNAIEETDQFKPNMALEIDTIDGVASCNINCVLNYTMSDLFR